MTTPGAADSALLNQILTTLTSLGERLAVVEADLKTVIRDHTKDLDDHEARIRTLETVAREVVTRDELATAAKDPERTKACTVAEKTALAPRGSGGTDPSPACSSCCSPCCCCSPPGWCAA